MELKPGYKQTEVGVIPEDWDVRRLSDLAQIRSGIAKNSNASHSNPVTVPYLRVANVQDGFLDLGEVSSILIGRDDLERYLLRTCDVLMNEGGDLDKLGRGAIWRGELKQCIHQNHVFAIRCTAALLPEFLNAWTSGKAARRYFVVAGKQTTNLASINKTAIGGLPIALPSPREQQQIAEAIDSVVTLEASIEDLIAKKSQIKLAAMQELLTGKRRLPGFEGEWELKRLGEHVKFLRNGVNSRAELHLEGSIKYLHYGDIHASADSFLSPQHLPCLSGAKAARLDRLRNGDLIFADASEDIAGVSKSVEILGACESEVVSGLHTIAARFDKAVLADGFKGFLQYVPSFYAHLRRLAAGTKVYATNRAHILSAEVRLPPVAEQKAIASVLIDMSNELGLLRDRMNKALSTKQGMMQQLLTGNIRLK